MARFRNTVGPFVAYHGCDRETAEQVLANKGTLKESDNSYDWLGPGIYFWIDSWERGLHFAKEVQARKATKIKNPYVIGAYIYPGLCLNLTDFAVVDELRAAHQALKASFKSNKWELPQNEAKKDGVFLKRHLDCAVIKTLHQARADNNEPPYDSVLGVFEEGPELFEGSGFKQKTHVQIAVRPQCIIGCFRVPSLI